MTKWQVHEAKRNLSEVIEAAQTDGPQVITRHGKDRAVLLSMDEYRQLEAAKPDFKAFLLSGPKIDSLDIERAKDTGREIDL